VVNPWRGQDALDPSLRDAEARITQLEAALGPAPVENEFLRHALQTAAKRGHDPRARGTLI
jgi:hypothetical protein